MMENTNTYKRMIVDDKLYIADCEKFAAQSSFFDILFNGGFLESFQDTVYIHEIEECVFDEVYTILESGRISFRCNIAISVYMACRYLCINDSIMTEFVNYLRRNFNKINMLRLLEYSWSHSDPIYADARDYVAKHIENLYELPSFADFPVSLLLDVLKSADLAITEEATFVDIIAEWLSMDPERKSDIPALLSALKPNCSLKMPLIQEWNFAYISVALETALFVPKIVRPYKSWISDHNDPLYVSKANERISIFHFEGTLWSELDRPMLPVEHTGRLCTQAARRQADLFITIPNGREDNCTFVHYNFRSSRKQILREVGNKVDEGLFWCNDELYACSELGIQRYSSQYDLWLNPLEMHIVNMAFYASDGRFLYTYATVDENQPGKCIYLYDDRCRDWNRLSGTTQFRHFACGGFFDSQFYAADKSFIECADLRAGKWQYIMPLPRVSRMPRNLTQCRDRLVVLDAHNNTFLADMREKRWTDIYPSDYYHTLNVVHCVDKM